MLLRMYQRWAERRGFTVEVDEATEGQEAGLLSATFIVHGRFAYGLLATERGVHRLVRMSPFDSQHRRQTSFASMDVTPFLEDVSVGGRDRREGPAHRHLPLLGRRGAARQQDGLGGAPDPPADRDRGLVPERAQPAPEQGQGDADPRRQAGRAGPRRAAGRAGRAEWRAGRQRLGEPDPLLRAGARTNWSRTCAPATRRATSTRCSTGTSTPSWRPSCAASARRRGRIGARAHGAPCIRSGSGTCCDLHRSR